jgi:hypothetical protein
MKKLIFGLVFVVLFSYFPGINLASARVLPKSEIQKRKHPPKPHKAPKPKEPKKPKPAPKPKTPPKPPWVK